MPSRPSCGHFLQFLAREACSRSHCAAFGARRSRGEVARRCRGSSAVPGQDHGPSSRLPVQTNSIAIAVASPPPMHSAATPRLPPVLRSAPISVTRMRAPEAPIGWPSAQAPPWTLTLSCGRPMFAHRRHGDDGEGLVDLEQIDLARAPADLVGELPDRADRRGGEPAGLLRMGAMADDGRQRREAELLRLGAAHHHQRRARRRRSSWNWPPSPCRLRGTRVSARESCRVGLERLLVHVHDASRPCRPLTVTGAISQAKVPSLSRPCARSSEAIA